MKTLLRRVDSLLFTFFIAGPMFLGVAWNLTQPDPPAYEASWEELEPTPAQLETPEFYRVPSRSELGIAERTHNVAAFMLHRDGHLALSEGAKWEQGIGEITFHVADDLIEFRRAVLPANLPEHLQALKGRTVAMYNAEREICRAAITSFYVVAYRDADSFFSANADWSPKRLSGSTTLAQLRDTDSESPPWLAASYQTHANCEPALWARDIQLSQPWLYRPQGRRSSDTLAYRRNFRTSTEARALRRSYLRDLEEQRYEDEDKPTGRDWRAKLRRDLRVRLWKSPDGFCRLVNLNFDASYECVDPYWEDEAYHFNELRCGDRVRRVEGPYDPIAIVDLEGDGRLTYVAEQDLGLKATGATVTAAKHLPRWWEGCRC